MSTTPQASLFRRIQLALMKAALHSVGRWSDGISIAFKHGFTSGVMLEYVYRNEPSGRWLIGKWIDRMYLNHPGWRVIRTRKENLEALLLRAVQLTREELGPPCVLDIAAGPGLYLLEVLKQDGGDDITAIARDLDENALATGRTNARQFGVDHIRYEIGDALERQSLMAVEPAPNIVVSSGFYDWITDDELIRRSMSLLAERLPPGGYFVFTNQSGHVDLDMAQALFVDFNGQPLRMTTRPADTMNRWAEEAGFAVLETRSDEHNHYSTTLAQRA